MDRGVLASGEGAKAPRVEVFRTMVSVVVAVGGGYVSRVV
jgi:hypothetical protein